MELFSSERLQVNKKSTLQIDRDRNLVTSSTESRLYIACLLLNTVSQRDMCKNRQDGLKSPVLSDFDNLPHYNQKSRVR